MVETDSWVPKFHTVYEIFLKFLRVITPRTNKKSGEPLKGIKFVNELEVELRMPYRREELQMRNVRTFRQKMIESLCSRATETTESSITPSMFVFGGFVHVTVLEKLIEIVFLKSCVGFMFPETPQEHKDLIWRIIQARCKL